MAMSCETRMLAGKALGAERGDRRHALVVGARQPGDGTADRCARGAGQPKPSSPTNAPSRAIHDSSRGRCPAQGRHPRRRGHSRRRGPPSSVVDARARWQTATRPGSTPCSFKTSSASSPLCPGATECSETGAPVDLCARATARSTRNSTGAIRLRGHPDLADQAAGRGATRTCRARRSASSSAASSSTVAAGRARRDGGRRRSGRSRPPRAGRWRARGARGRRGRARARRASGRRPRGRPRPRRARARRPSRRSRRDAGWRGCRAGRAGRGRGCPP